MRATAGPRLRQPGLRLLQVRCGRNIFSVPNQEQLATSIKTTAPGYGFQTYALRASLCCPSVIYI